MKNLNKLIKISLLSAIAFVLMYLEIALPFFPDFLKIDISDIPALLGAFALGPVAGVVIEFLKNLLHILFKGTTTAMIGETANFLVGAALVFTAGMIYKRNKNKKSAIVSIIISIIVMAAIASIMNYFVLLPMYAKLFNFKLPNSFIIYTIIPFNLLKGTLAGGITLGLYKSVSPVLHREATRDAAINKKEKYGNL